jgi:hypothetical protein
VVYGLFNPNDDENSSVIVVTSGEIQWLETNWQKLWNRPPTPEEKNGIVDQLIREKVLYKAAVEMGLDKDDVIIRRRMAQKIEFLTSDIIAPPVPKEGDLEEYYKENITQYRIPDAITITQAFFDPDKRGEETLDDAAKALALLKRHGEPKGGMKGLGDVFMLQDYYSERSKGELSKLFGSEFASTVFELEPDTWNGPILSGYGTHLVYVHSLNQATPPAFTDVANIVEKDWQEKKVQELNEAYIESLMSRYQIVVEDEVQVTDG